MSEVLRNADVDEGVELAADRGMPTPRRRRGSMADEVGAHLRDLILTGHVRPGERVDQQALSDELHVSRSPIREALVVLAQEGLVRLSPNRGAFVADITQADIIEHYEVFGTISGRIASLAAEQLSDDDLVRLAETHRRFESGNPVVMSRANEEFHRIINSVATRRTRWLLALLERSVPADYYEFSGDLYENAVDDHRAILDALVARDPASARWAMETHLSNGGRAATEALWRQGFWKDSSKA
ncbi:MAG: GntR family transcriptional regulator [Ilumatobacter sp.]|uniref:GntR family transcriptional regulator n=1 Tax=Ilumatobacter sp. TaxID=1967498 RepID=UPI003C74C58D